MKQKNNEYEIPFDVKEEKKFIVPERYTEQKNEVKKHRDCRNKTLAEIVCVEPRMYAEYISGRYPIPADRLKKMADYMEVNPDWLIGKSEERISEKTKNIDNYALSYDLDDSRGGLANAYLSKYLDYARIQSPFNYDSADDSKYMTVNGVVLSYHEYKYYLQEMRYFIENYSSRLVQTIKKSRNKFE